MFIYDRVIKLQIRKKRAKRLIKGFANIGVNNICFLVILTKTYFLTAKIIPLISILENFILPFRL